MYDDLLKRKAERLQQTDQPKAFDLDEELRKLERIKQ
jgi:hypothetical protein